MDTGLKRCLMEIFPVLRSMEGEQRELQFKLIGDNYDIVDFKNIGDVNIPFKQPDVINPYFFYSLPHHIERPYIIIKFDKVSLRGRRTVTFDTQYAQITSNGPDSTPQFICYENTAVVDGKFGTQFSGDRNHGWQNPLHPHISGNIPCLGQFENMMYKEAVTNPVGYFALVSKFYRTWNVGSPYWNINEMRPLYSNLDENGNRRILLSAFQHERMRSTGVRSAHLQRYLPHLDLKKISLSSIIQPLRVMSLIDNSWSDMWYGNLYRDVNIEAEGVDGYTDIWNEAYNKILEVAGNNFVFYKQTPKDSIMLTEMYRAISDYMDMNIVNMTRERWLESIELNGNEIFEKLISLQDATLFDMSESVVARKDVLQSNDFRQYWMLNENECAEYLSMSIPFRPDAPSSYKEPDGEMQRFWPEDMTDLIKSNKYECGKVAITKLEKQKERIANEIRTLDSNPIENSILQQQIQF